MKILRYNEYLDSDAIGYNIGKYLYHVTPKTNINNIKKTGLRPQGGISINGEKFSKRLYFTTSLIAAYDLSVNFESYKDENGDYYIFKLDSSCIKDFKKDPLFMHGIYVDYVVPYSCVIDVIRANDLFGQYDDGDFEKLYEYNQNPHLIMDSQDWGSIEGVVHYNKVNVLNWLGKRRVYDDILTEHNIKLPISFLNNVNIEEDERGKGYGNQLLDWFIDESIDAGAKFIILESDSMESQVEGFDLDRWYIDHGFEIITNNGENNIMMYEI